MYKMDLKGKGTRDQIANIHQIIEKAREFQEKTSTSASLTTLKLLTLWNPTNCGKFFKRCEYRPPSLPPEKAVYRSGSNSQNRTWNNRLVPNRKRSTSRLFNCHPVYLTYIEYIMRNAGLEEAQAGIKIAGRNINNLRYADDTTLTAKSEEELKSS